MTDRSVPGAAGRRAHGPVQREVVLGVALRLGVAERRDVFTTFFARHPGSARTSPGLGRALVDFLAWEIDSGRVTDSGGSAWWKAVNGMMVLDIAAAAGQPEPIAGPTWPGVLGRSALAGAGHDQRAAWLRYAAAEADAQQAALWRAHAVSMARAVDLAAPLLAAEGDAERRFVAIVLRVLEGATRRCVATDSPELGNQVRHRYPAGYPISEEGVAALARASAAAPSEPQDVASA